MVHTKKIWTQIKTKSKVRSIKRIDPPLLILFSGVFLAGKSTLALFLKEHIKIEGNDKIELISTDSILEVMKMYISKV